MEFRQNFPKYSGGTKRIWTQGSIQLLAAKDRALGVFPPGVKQKGLLLLCQNQSEDPPRSGP